MSVQSATRDMVKAPEGSPSSGGKPAHEVSPEQLKKLARRVELYISIGLVSGMVALWFFGAEYWDERYYTPEEGLGYYLGMGGGIIMLLAYCYTAFKYVPKLRTRAVMKYWLTVHLYFGVLGPYIILIHSTFQFGALNSNIALISLFGVC